MKKEDHYKILSHLINLRDDLLNLERELAGRANFYGLQMHLPERIHTATAKIEFVKSCLSPRSFLKYKLNKLLEDYRLGETASGLRKQVLLSIEALAFWGDLAYELVVPLGSPYTKLAGAGADLALKATLILSREREEALHKTMNQFWNEAQRFRKLHAQAIKEIDREIAALK